MNWRRRLPSDVHEVDIALFGDFTQALISTAVELKEDAPDGPEISLEDVRCECRGCGAVCASSQK